MKNLRLHHYLTIALTLIAMASLAHAQTYTELYNFDCVNDGCSPYQPGLLAQGQDGSLSGTLPSQIFGNGTAFNYTLSGVFTRLYEFPDPASAPQSGLSLGFDGNLYGAAETGGPARKGTVFKISAGVTTVLHTFTDGADGAFPFAPPIQAPDGNIYGVTSSGTNPGKAYKITPSGTFSVIATLPYATQAPLILGADGKLYGTTPYGGTSSRGTFFQMTTAGKVKVIYNFGSDSVVPIGPVLQASDGKFYGTTWGGGTGGQGIVYQLTTGGVYKVLHNFQSATDGAASTSGLVQGSDKFLYGVASAGGANGFGTLFKINTTGTTFAVLHNFDKSNGATPFATPTLHTNGKIYGVTQTGGSKNSTYGDIYSFDNGLKPFASLVVIWSGKVGTSVGILGQGFLTATGVKFGTGPGTFKVINDSYMTATPTAGATTGNVTVLEPGGNLVTPQIFKVIPAVSAFSPTSGPVGTQVVITGMSLQQTSGVKIGGVKVTSFTVNSNTQVTATVPVGAVTGTIVVTTKGGSVIAPGTFTVN